MGYGPSELKKHLTASQLNALYYTYMLQAFLLQLLYRGVLSHFLQPLRALRGTDVDLQHVPREDLLFLHEHG